MKKASAKKSPKPSKTVSRTLSHSDLFRMMEQKTKTEFDECSIQVAIQAAVHSIADLACEEKSSERSSMLVARFLAASQKAFTLANANIDHPVLSIRIGATAIPVLDLLESICWLFNHGLRLDRSIDPSEVRVLFDANGIPAKPFPWIQIAKEVEGSIAALPALDDDKRHAILMRTVMEEWNRDEDATWQKLRLKHCPYMTPSALRMAVVRYAEGIPHMKLKKKSPGNRRKREK